MFPFPKGLLEAEMPSPKRKDSPVGAFNILPLFLSGPETGRDWTGEGHPQLSTQGLSLPGWSLVTHLRGQPPHEEVFLGHH